MNPLRLLLAIYARLERPLLRFNYWLVRSPLVRWPVTRQLLWLGVFLPISYAGAAGQPMTADEAVELLRAAGKEGVIAVGPCGCRVVHHGCDHPTRTDFTVYEGVEAWSRAHPAQYQVVSLAEAEAIVRDCRSQGMIQVFYRTGMGGGVGYALCNCCLDGCLPLMNRQAYRNYRFIRGAQVAQVDADRCTACGTCAEVCAFGARGADGALDDRHCYGCGLCADVCPAGAVTMVSQEKRG
jgi:ferredoxin